MAEEMLFTVAGSVAMPAQMISLEEAGLEQRADLQEWVLSNPGHPRPRRQGRDLRVRRAPGGRGRQPRPRLGARSRGRRPPGGGRAQEQPVRRHRGHGDQVRRRRQPHAARVAGRPLRPLPVPSPDPDEPGGGAGRAAGACARPLARVAAPAPHRAAGPRLLGRRDRQRGLAERNGPRHRARPGQRLPLLRLRAAGQQQRADDLGEPDLPGARGRGVHHQPGAPAGQGDGRVQAAGAGRGAGAAARRDRVGGRRDDLHAEPAHRPQLRHAETSSRSGSTWTPPGARRTGRTTSTRRWSGTSTRRPTRRPVWSATSSSRPPASAATTPARSGGATRPAGTWPSWRGRSAAARAPCTASTGRAGSTRCASATRSGRR